MASATFEEARQFLYEKYDPDEILSDEEKPVENGYAFPAVFKHKYMERKGDLIVRYYYDFDFEKYKLTINTDNTTYRIAGCLKGG